MSMTKTIIDDSLNLERPQTIQERRKQITFWLLTISLLILCICSLTIGAMPVSTGQTLAILSDLAGLQLPWRFSYPQEVVIATIRAPRLMMALLTGSVLAVSGAAMQGLFRNPLADPALMGVSSGATLAAVAVIVLEATLSYTFSGWIGAYILPASAFLGGFLSTLLVYQFAMNNGRSDVSSLILAGIAINALAGSITGLLIYTANDEQLRTITFWTMGSLSGVTWSQVMAGLPFFLSTLCFLPYFSRALNALLLGEAEAGHLGFPVERIKLLVIILVALGVGTSVSFTGMIGFVGLVVPHLLRLWLGPDHCSLLPASALLGAVLLLLADILARTLLSPAELPIGIITGVLGGPFFLWLLRRQKITGGF